MICEKCNKLYNKELSNVINYMTKNYKMFIVQLVPVIILFLISRLFY